MQFRQQRRRRVWPEEVTRVGLDSDDPAATTGAGGPPRETYTAQARRDEQPRLTDLVPTRRRVLALWYAAGAATIGLLEFLHARLDWLGEQLAPAVPRVLDLAERGSLAAWCSSAWLSITALVSILLYSLRRHRIDDYRARYRVWIWAALAWLVLAVNQTAPWDDLVRELTERGAARIGLARAWLWPAVCCGLALVAAVRLSIEMRDSRLSLALFWLGSLAWAAALAAGRLTIGSLEPEAQTMLVAGLTLIGQWTILSAHVAYARHVLLDAHGLIAPRAESRRPRLGRRKQKPAVEKPAAGVQHTAAASGAKAPGAAASKPVVAPAKPTAAPATAASKPTAAPAVTAKPIASAQTPSAGRLGVVAQKSDEDDEDDPSLRQLSRAERKRLKRQHRGQFRDAA
jgi:hypothetical protein